MPLLPPLPQQFTADIVRSDGDATRIYFDRGYKREEDITGPMRTFIVRPDKRTVYAVDDDAKAFNQHKVSKKAWEEAEIDTDAFCNWRLDGTRRIDGRLCLRYIGRYREASGKAYEVCFVDAKTEMRRREVTYDRRGKKALTVDYVNVTLGPPDPRVFEIPKGYKREKF